MNCEVCGKEIVKGYRVLVERSELTVCESCKNFGVEQPLQNNKNKKTIITAQIKKRETKIEFEYELADNYHEIIRKEREKRRWSQAELAKRIQEKESTIKKIENRELIPEPRLIEKLEKIFNVKLKEGIQEVKLEKRRTPALTFGDVVIVRKKEKPHDE